MHVEGRQAGTGGMRWSWSDGLQAADLGRMCFPRGPSDFPLLGAHTVQKVL